MSRPIRWRTPALVKLPRVRPVNQRQSSRRPPTSATRARSASGTCSALSGPASAPRPNSKRSLPVFNRRMRPASHDLHSRRRVHRAARLCAARPNPKCAASGRAWGGRRCRCTQEVWHGAGETPKTRLHRCTVNNASCVSSPQAVFWQIHVYDALPSEFPLSAKSASGEGAGGEVNLRSAAASGILAVS